MQNGAFQSTVPGSGMNLWPADWKVSEDTGGYGDFAADANVDVEFGFGFNPNAVRLTADSFAAFESTWPAGSSGSGRATIANHAQLTGRYLVFDILAGGYGGTIFDSGKAGFNFAVVVTNPLTGNEYIESIASQQFGSPSPGCGVGLSFTGLLNPETVCIDLSAHGFSQNDIVKVRFVMQSNAAALGECDVLSEIFATVLLTNVRICTSCPSGSICPCKSESLEIEHEESLIYE